MVFVSTSIEIERSPEQVRDVFLDWAKLPEWSRGNIKSIQPVSDKKPIDIVKGDKLKITFDGGMKVTATVSENSAQKFGWEGGLPIGILTAEHTFRFEPSKTTPGHTTFFNEENFHGLISSMMKSASGGFEKFNANLKARVESAE